MGLGPRAEPSGAIMPPWEKPPASERLLASLRDTRVASRLEGGGVAQFIVNGEEHRGRQLIFPPRREPLMKAKFPTLP